MTARIYPEKESDGILFFADKPIELVRLDKWDINKFS